MATTPFQFFTSPLVLNPPPKILVPPLFAGRSKKKKFSGGRIEGPGDVRREAKESARKRNKRMEENKFYHKSKKSSIFPDSFTEDELNMIGLGYDRAVRFMSGPDDPRLRHPHDWYKYGQFGPYSWRGIVIGPPIRGRFTDERVTLISSINSHEESDEIEKFEMATKYSQSLAKLNPKIGIKHFWVFVRHPKWRPSEEPWNQWTLVSEVAIESSHEERIDKWTLLTRLGNRTRSVINQCAAWQRPDIVYVKKPIYQLRFEPQIDFFGPLGPLLDPETESDFQFFIDENSPPCTYFQGLCKLVKANPKSYVDDVVKAYEKLDDQGKSNCLQFLLGNHPYELLHPFNREWKIKLEEMEFGCDAPDEEEENLSGVAEEWSECEEEVVEEEEEEEEEIEEEEEEREEFWEEEWEKAMRSSEEMEKFVGKSAKASAEASRRKREEEEREEEEKEESEDEIEELREKMMREREEENEREERRRRREEGPPGMFLKAAVRPFTYRNLVKEIVLMRHGIVDGDICTKNWRV